MPFQLIFSPSTFLSFCNQVNPVSRKKDEDDGESEEQDDGEKENNFHPDREPNV